MIERELEELEYEVNDIAEKLFYNSANPKKLIGIDKRIHDEFFKLLPKEKFGEIYLHERSKIFKAFKKIEKWWEEEYWEWESLIEDALKRVIEGAKEDIAMEKDIEPEEVEEEELDDEVLWQWFGEEWSHNVKDRHWIADLFKGPSSLPNLQMVIRSGLEDAVYTKLVTSIEQEADLFVHRLKGLITELDKKINRPHIIKWAFGQENYPIKR